MRFSVNLTWENNLNIASKIMLTTKFLNFIECETTGIIQLNRPAALNALHLEMWKNLYELLYKMENQKDLVILKGLGKVFCAGGDIKELSNSTLDYIHAVCTFGCKSFHLIANYKKPYIVLIDGLAMGGAATYSMPGKYRIATERTAFSMPETSIGYFNDAGSSYFLSRLDNNFGIYMGLTGIPVRGFDMKKVGLATHFIESHKLDEVEKSLIKCKTHEDVERILSEASSEPPSNATELDEVLPKINKCFSGATVEEIFDKLLHDGSDWAKKTLSILNQKSPNSLKVSHRSITTGRNMSLKGCLEMEMLLTINHVDGSDFKEGVRALLIDKDSKPKWSRKSIYDVTEEDVELFFKPVPESYELRLEERMKNKL